MSTAADPSAPHNFASLYSRKTLKSTLVVRGARLCLSMGFNAAGLRAVAEVIFRPHLLAPKLIINDIRQLKLDALKAKGVIGVVLDKDNCLTKPHEDHIVPELQEAWPALTQTFGRRNVLIVSNSAGTRDDAGFLQAESVSRHLRVPVLLHETKKPGCTQAVVDYFEAMHQSETPRDLTHSSSIANEAAETRIIANTTERPVILVIGDRVMTDVVLANRISARSTVSTTTFKLDAVAVLTRAIWQKEKAGTRVMRALENMAMRRALKAGSRSPDVQGASWQDCIIQAPSPVPPSHEQPAQTPSKPLREYFTRSFMLSLLSRAPLGLVRLLQLVVRPVEKRLRPLLHEARQAQYGFHYPESVRRTQALRKVLEGQPGKTDHRTW